MFNSKAHSEQFSCFEVLFKKLLFFKFSTLTGVGSLDKFDFFDSLSDRFAKSDIIFYEFSIEDVVFKGTGQLEGLKQLIDLGIWILISSHQFNDFFVSLNDLLIVRINLLFTIILIKSTAVMCLDEVFRPQEFNRFQQPLEAGHARRRGDRSAFLDRRRFTFAQISCRGYAAPRCKCEEQGFLHEIVIVAVFPRTCLGFRFLGPWHRASPSLQSYGLHIDTD